MKTEKQIERRMKLVEAAIAARHPTAFRGYRYAYCLGGIYGARYALGWVFGGGRWPSWLTAAAQGIREAKKAQP